MNIVMPKLTNEKLLEEVQKMIKPVIERVEKLEGKDFFNFKTPQTKPMAVDNLKDYHLELKIDQWSELSELEKKDFAHKLADLMIRYHIRGAGAALIKKF